MDGYDPAGQRQTPRPRRQTPGPGAEGHQCAVAPARQGAGPGVTSVPTAHGDLAQPWLRGKISGNLPGQVKVQRRAPVCPGPSPPRGGTPGARGIEPLAGPQLGEVRRLAQSQHPTSLTLDLRFLAPRPAPFSRRRLGHPQALRTPLPGLQWQHQYCSRAGKKGTGPDRAVRPGLGGGWEGVRGSYMSWTLQSPSWRWASLGFQSLGKGPQVWGFPASERGEEAACRFPPLLAYCQAWAPGPPFL